MWLRAWFLILQLQCRLREADSPRVSDPQDVLGALVNGAVRHEALVPFDRDALETLVHVDAGAHVLESPPLLHLLLD